MHDARAPAATARAGARQGAPGGDEGAPPGRARRRRREVVRRRAGRPHVTLYVGNVRVRDLQYPVITADGVTVDKFSQPDRGHRGGRRAALPRPCALRTTMTPVRPGPIELHHDDERSVRRHRRGGFDPFFDQFFPGDAQAGRDRRPTRRATRPSCRCPRRASRRISAAPSAASTSRSAPSRPSSQVGDPITVRMEISGTRQPSPTLTPPDGAGRRPLPPLRCAAGEGRGRRGPPRLRAGGDPEVRRRARAARRALQLLRSGRARLPDDHPGADRRFTVQAGGRRQADVVDAAAPVAPTPARRSAARARHRLHQGRAGRVPACAAQRSTSAAVVRGCCSCCRWRCSPACRPAARRRDRLAADPRLRAVSRRRARCATRADGARVRSRGRERRSTTRSAPH